MQTRTYVLKIAYSVSDQKLTLTCEPSLSDIEFFSQRKGKLTRNSADFELGKDFDVRAMHPDTLALLALIIFGPFAKNDISLSWAISQDLAEACSTSFRRKIGPVDPSLVPRKVTDPSRPALAFSGGVDSYAALALLPEDTVPVFCLRTRPEGVPVGLYRAEAAINSCEELRASHHVEIVKTNMEYVRDPVGFSVDWTNAAGAILLADHYHFNSVSFGMIMESAYFIGHPYYSDLRARSVYKAWAPLFEAVNIPIALPTAGLSEVVTSKIVATKEDEWHPESCVRGKVGAPCMNCFKCFRKTILDAKLNGSTLSVEHFDIAKRSKEVKRRLLEVPIHHENVLAFSLLDLKCDDNPILDAMRRKTLPIVEYGKSLSTLERHYTKSRELVPGFLWPSVSTAILKYATPYTNSDVELIENWEISSLTKQEVYQTAQKDLLYLLSV